MADQFVPASHRLFTTLDTVGELEMNSGPLSTDSTCGTPTVTASRSGTRAARTVNEQSTSMGGLTWLTLYQ
jgi:hypothetical protein